jgi:hypothetical protein
VKPGDQILRRDLHEALGGQTQSGISPSTKAPVVMLFSDPASGEQHGYFDGWDASDGYFHYSGEGQRGDQEMKRGNKAIRDHGPEGRRLEVFFGNGKGRPVTYVGQFEYVDHYETDAPETGGGPVRKVLMFRLAPLEALPRPVSQKPTLATQTEVVLVPIEQHFTERTVIDPGREPTEGERRESALVQRYQGYLRGLGHEPERHRIRPEGELKPLYTDVFDPIEGLLIEAKGTVTREAVRMAIGQLMDYRRFIEPQPRLAVLVPSEPRADLVELLHGVGASVIWPDEQSFVRLDPAAA